MENPSAGSAPTQKIQTNSHHLSHPTYLPPGTYNLSPRKYRLFSRMEASAQGWAQQVRQVSSLGWKGSAEQSRKEDQNHLQYSLGHVTGFVHIGAVVQGRLRRISSSSCDKSDAVSNSYVLLLEAINYYCCYCQKLSNRGEQPNSLSTKQPGRGCWPAGGARQNIPQRQRRARRLKIFAIKMPYLRIFVTKMLYLHFLVTK